MFQFPFNPAVGDLYNPTGGITFRWNGTAWYLVSSPSMFFTQPALFADGTLAAPGISWANEPTAGWRRHAASDFRYVIAGSDLLAISAAQFSVVTPTVFNNTVTMGAPLIVAGGRVANINATRQVITASGNYIKPASLLYVDALIVGGGGAGGGTPATGPATLAVGGGGGAAGWSKIRILATALAASEPVVVGLGGAGVVGGNGGSGGTSQFFTAVGSPGSGGGGAVGSPVTALAGQSGVGSGGDENGKGDPATHAFALAGTTIQPGNGAGSYFGGGALAQAWGGGVAGVSALATAYGASGSGAGNNVSESARSGGNGAPGVVMITEYHG